ncbi:hypothetical protein LCGC14_2247720 [marine sediment metagenome]|uniref:MT-A70 family protein n=1 Tax=marine sediment metagenome TaxID=412755 RepID=A0A0F9D391_9ZZZZ
MIPFPNKKYKIIYADPPWKYGCWYKSEKIKRNAADHYKVTPTSELKQYKIPSAENSVCLMWVTFPCLKEGIELLAYLLIVYGAVLSHLHGYGAQAALQERRL